MTAATKRPAAAADLIGGQPNEVVFTRGATEAINLVAQTLPDKGRNRVLLSQLEHHSNIVPWQLAGYEIDAVPLTADGQIDLDAAEAMLTEEHAWSPSRTCRTCSARSSTPAARPRSPMQRCAAAARRVPGRTPIGVNIATLGADFYAFSGHKLYGPTGIGCLWGRAEMLAQCRRGRAAAR